MASTVRRYTGNPNIKWYYCASATPAFVKGDLVDLTTSGTLEIGASGAFYGIAMGDAPASTSVLTPVDVIDNSKDEFIMKSHVTTAATYIGDVFDVACTTTAPATTTDSNHDLVVVGIWPGEAVGTTNGHLIVKFMPGALTALTGI
jgi:hypothetical protein